MSRDIETLKDAFDEQFESETDAESDASGGTFFNCHSFQMTCTCGGGSHTACIK